MQDNVLLHIVKLLVCKQLIWFISTSKVCSINKKIIFKVIEKLKWYKLSVKSLGFLSND